MQLPVVVSFNVPLAVSLLPKIFAFSYGAIKVELRLASCKLLSLYEASNGHWNFIFNVQLSGSVTPGIHSLYYGHDAFQLGIKLKLGLDDDMRVRIRLHDVDIKSPFYIGYDLSGNLFGFSLSELMTPQKIAKSPQYEPVLSIRTIIATLAAFTTVQDGEPIASKLSVASKFVADKMTGLLKIAGISLSTEQLEALDKSIKAMLAMVSQESFARWNKVFMALLKNSSNGDLVACVNEALFDVLLQAEEEFYASYRTWIVKLLVDVHDTVGSWFIPYLKLKNVDKYTAPTGEITEIRAGFTIEFVVNGQRALVYSPCKDVPMSLTSRLEYANDIIFSPTPLLPKMNYQSSLDLGLPGQDIIEFNRATYVKDLSYKRFADPFDNAVPKSNQKLLPAGRSLSVFISSSLLSYYATNFLSTGPGFVYTDKLQTRLRGWLEVALLKKPIKELTGWSVPIEFGRFEVMPSVVVTSDSSARIDVYLGHTQAKYQPLAPFDVPYSGLNANTILSASIAVDEILSKENKSIAVSAKLVFLKAHKFELDSDFFSLSAGDVVDFVMSIAPALAFVLYHALRRYLGVAKPYQGTWEAYFGSTDIDFGDIKSVMAVAKSVANLNLGNQDVLLVYNGQLTSEAKKLISAIGKYVIDKDTGKPMTVSSVESSLIFTKVVSFNDIPEPFRSLVSTVEMTTLPEGVQLEFSSAVAAMPVVFAPTAADPALIEVGTPVGTPAVSELTASTYNPFDQVGNVIEVKVVSSYLQLKFLPIPSLLPFFAAIPGLGLLAPAVKLESVSFGWYSKSSDNLVNVVHTAFPLSEQGFMSIPTFSVWSIDTEWSSWWLKLKEIVDSPEVGERVDKIMKLLAETPNVELLGSSNTTQFGQTAIEVKISVSLDSTYLETVLNLLFDIYCSSDILSDYTMQTWSYLMAIVTELWDTDFGNHIQSIDSPYLFQATWLNSKDIQDDNSNPFPFP